MDGIEPGDEPAPAADRTDSEADGAHWSPLSTRNARWSWALLGIFSAIYFTVAILTAAEFADLAAIIIFGLPLGFYMGMGLIISGLVITRIYLARVEG